MNNCKHKYIFLDTWQGSIRYEEPDKLVFFCEKCLDIQTVDKQLYYKGEKTR